MNQFIIGSWSGLVGEVDAVWITVQFLPNNSYVVTQTHASGRTETVHGVYTLQAENYIEVKLAPLDRVVERLSVTLSGDTLILHDQHHIAMTLTRATR